MKQYHDLLKYVLDNGTEKSDRTGTGTKSVFGYQMRFNLRDGFPLVTTKKIHWKSVAIELLWFLAGNSNTRFLEENNVTIWREWQDEDGGLGPVYPSQWRAWSFYDEMGDIHYIDQIASVIDSIKTNPDSRRHIVNAWHLEDIPYMALPPCHLLFQFYVVDGRLSCQLYQRSADVFLGCPFNIASYALLTHMVAHVTGLEVGEFIHTIGDAHLYLNHIDQARLQLTRTPKDLPRLQLNPDIKDIDDFTFDDIVLLDYKFHPPIKAKVAV